MGNGSRKYHREAKESLEKQLSERELRRWKLDFCPRPRCDEEIGGEWTTEEHEVKYQHLTNVRVSIWVWTGLWPDTLHLLFCHLLLCEGLHICSTESKEDDSMHLCTSILEGL